MSTIPLAKTYDEKKAVFPCLVSIKLDGVPIRIDIGADYKVTVQSRQGKPVPSVEHMVRAWVDTLKYSGDFTPPMTFIGELMQEDIFAPFKDTSGLARQHEPTNDLNLWLFDWCGPLGMTYVDRVRTLRKHLPKGMKVRLVEFLVFHSHDELMAGLDELLKQNPKAEGFVARDPKDGFEPGKRSWGYLKVLPEPTIDLRIVGFEEAISKDGEPLGMVGRLIAEYKGGQIGIGPGKLTHDERRSLWMKYIDNDIGVHMPHWGIAQIKYKPDDSYDALRQPTFQHWRDDKDVPDA